MRAIPVLPLLLIGAAAACSRPTVEWRLADDLVAAESLVRGGGTVEIGERVCRDETWLGFSMTPGNAVQSEIAWRAGSELVLAGCLECPSAEPGDAVLGWRVTGGNDGIGGGFAVDPGEGWWERALQLDPSPGEGVLHLDAQIPEGCSLALREVAVRTVVTEPPRRVRPPQVLLISVDTLRWDAVNHPAVATPNLDRLAAEGESWSRHYAGSSWTLPSHATMLTGYPTWVHGAANKQSAIDPRVPTVAERFSSAGFDTAALVFDAGWLDPAFGFDRGFASYDVRRWRIDRQVEALLSWVREHRERPFFFFLHTFEPHSDFETLPYEAPGVSRRTIAERFGIAGYGCRGGVCASRFLKGLGRGEIERRDHDRTVLRHLYDSGVGHTDEALGRLFNGLRRADVWDDLLVVVTSDHGEEFFEHGGTLHTTLFEEIIRVPLIVKWPGGARAGLRHDHPTGAVDLAPTLLGAAGVAAHDLPGEQLHDVDGDRMVLAADFATAVIVGRHKGIFGGARHLDLVFDLEHDPGEERNLAAARPELRRRLIDRGLERVRGDRDRFGVADPLPTTRPEIELGVEELERLRALGYLD